MRRLLLCVAMSSQVREAAADNNVFLATLATMPQTRSVFYNCNVEVGTELIDPLCQKNCKRRLFFLVQRPGRANVLLAAIFRDFQHGSDWLESRERRYLAEFSKIKGQPRISGVLRTGRDGRVLSLRLKTDENGEVQHAVCFGVGARHTLEAVDR